MIYYKTTKIKSQLFTTSLKTAQNNQKSNEKKSNHDVI